jgi:hypothetical protein
MPVLARRPLVCSSIQVKGSVNTPKGFLTSFGMTKGREKALRLNSYLIFNITALILPISYAHPNRLLRKPIWSDLLIDYFYWKISDMIFFFGTRSGKTETKKLEDVSCPHCEQSNTLTASKTSNYIHIFWIRLIKISTNSIAECSYCKRGFYEN